MTVATRRYSCSNLNGSQTGIGRAEELPDGKIRCWAGFGSPFAGQVCDDGPEYEAVVETWEQAEQWMSKHGMYSK